MFFAKPVVKNSKFIKIWQSAKYTKSHKPVKILYQCEFDTKSDAMKEEIRIKHLSRKAKLDLINGL